MNERRTYHVNFSKAEVLAALRAHYPTVLTVQAISPHASLRGFPQSLPTSVEFTWTSDVSTVKETPEVVTEETGEAA